MHTIDEGLCPYCHNFLNPVPKSKKKCPYCSNYILVRTYPDISSFPTVGYKMLLTDQEAKMQEQLWAEDNVLNEFLTTIHVNEERYKLFWNEEMSKFNKTSKRDVLWSIYNQLVIEYSSKGDFKMASWVHYQQALCLNWRGGDCNSLLKIAANEELMFYKNQGVRQVTIISGECEECKKINNMVLDIDDALKNGPIPCKNCTTKFFEDKKPFCRCTYSPH